MLCECGCGSPAPIATITDRRAGTVKGAPRRFILGHSARVQYRGREQQYVEEDRGYETPCHIWVSTHDDLGYGRLAGRVAHLQRFERLVGKVPSGYELDHLCRQRDCVRLDHLEVVTHAENCRRGASTKLSAEAVRAIRARSASGERRRALAAEYEVTVACIQSVLLRKSWKDI